MSIFKKLFGGSNKKPNLTEDILEPWPFDQPTNCAVFTSTHVMHENQPITHVYHDADDEGWQFHYPGETSSADAMIVGLREVCLHDLSVVELADLPVGWFAVRSGLGEPWSRHPNQ